MATTAGVCYKMAGCDIQNGRLHDDCLDQIAGVKTVYFYNWNKLSVQRNPAGEIIYFGMGTVFRFEQPVTHGLALQEIRRGEGDTQYMYYQIDMTVQYVTPEFLQTLQYLRAGMWGIFFLDMEDNIRLMGADSPMVQIELIDQSGTGPGDLRWTNLSFKGMGSDYASFLEPFTTFPFDNFPDIVVIPQYEHEEGDLIYNDAGELYIVDPAETFIKYA